MDHARAPRIAAAALAVAAVAAVLVMGLQLRLPDTLGNPVMAAEDPYTHMALVREHLRDGEVAPPDKGTSLYPPGLHALLAAWWSFAGGDLYDLARGAPVAFGVVGIAGLALLVGRWEGALAGFAAAFAMAAMPEAIHRTTMLSPTALDLALLPFLGLALLEALRGRLGWLAAAAPLAVFLVVAHPWVVALLALGGAAFLVLYLLVPWSRGRAPQATVAGAVGVAAVLGGAFGLAAATRWDASGTGFGELAETLFKGAPELQTMLLGVALAGLGYLALLAVPRVRARIGPGAGRGLAVRCAAAVALAVAVWLVWVPAEAQGMPEFVDLPRNLGAPVLALALAGLVLTPVVGGPAAYLGAGLFLATFPLSVHNPLDSPYWPHRTVVFLGLGSAVLAGVAVARSADALRLGLGWVAERRAASRSTVVGRHGRSALLATTLAQPRGGGSRLAAAALPALLVGSVFAGGALAAMPEPYDGGWYRYFTPCEFAEMRAAAAAANQDPRAVVLLGSWQSRLTMAAFTDDIKRLWYAPVFFKHEAKDLAGWMDKKDRWGKPTYVVVDRYALQDLDAEALGNLQQPGFEKVRGACHGQGLLPEKFALYRIREGAL